MPTAEGPCRFGQYAPYLRHVLDANGYGDVEILSPTSKNAYGGLGDTGRAVRAHRLARAAGRRPAAKAAADATGRTRRRGDAEAVYEECLDDLCRTLENTPVEPGVQLAALRDAMVRAPRPLPQAPDAPRPGSLR